MYFKRREFEFLLRPVSTGGSGFNATDDMQTRAELGSDCTGTEQCRDNEGRGNVGKFGGLMWHESSLRMCRRDVIVGREMNDFAVL